MIVLLWTLLAYLLFRELEMSDPARSTQVERPRRASRVTGVLGSGARNDPGQLRLRVTRRTEPEMRKLVEWVLNIAQTRYDAHQAGEPDPYDLPLPDDLATDTSGSSADRQRTIEVEHHRRSTA